MPGAVRAAQLHPALETALTRLGDDERVSIILIHREQAPLAQLDDQLKRARATRRERHAQVIAALQAASRAQAPLLEALRDGVARGVVAGYTPYWVSNLVVARVTRSFLFELSARADVAWIEPNFSVALIEPPGDPVRQAAPAEAGRGIGVTPGLRAINADRVWHELGLNGAGTLVANCDTGVDGHHPALAGRWRGAHGHPVGECWLNLYGNHPEFPWDLHGHGTHVMGTLTGLGETTQDTVGVAWGALWIATDPLVQSPGNDAFDNDIITAYQWFADPDGDPQTLDDVPDVVQNSWRIHEGFPGGYTDCDSRWWSVIDHCETAGVVTIWSAGNEGTSGAQTIGSPADRATTITNAFSVGAVDATSYPYPWPIANLSSRGPTGCDVPPDRKIKPEVTAPGVEVYSSVVGGGYEQTGWSGTSMAGPHVAGVVALMRQANPDADVDLIKEILMQTARDHGVAGEDNTYGWGVIDAYAAVTAVMTGYGTLAGTISNGSSGGTPVPGARIEALEPGRAITSGHGGGYRFSVPAGRCTVRVSHPSFATRELADVEVVEGETTLLDCALTDVAAPLISGTGDLRSTADPVGPYEVSTTVDDWSALQRVEIHYRVDGGALSAVPMAARGESLYTGAIPGQPHTSFVEYCIHAVDVAGNPAWDPPGAPEALYDFYVAPGLAILADSVEAGPGGWSHEAVTGGFGDQWHISSERNHTPGGALSWKCGDTGGQGYGTFLDAALVTPPFELTIDSHLSYWQWIEAEPCGAYPGYGYDGGRVEIEVGGIWTPIEPEGGYTHLIRTRTSPGPFPAETPVFSGSADWHEVRCDLSGYAGTVRLRFRFGSDVTGTREGWHIDDLAVDGFRIDFSHVTPEPDERLEFRATEGPRLIYRLTRPNRAEVQMFDAGGRVVRTLLRGEQSAGRHVLLWDGRADDGRLMPAGVYLSRLRVGDASATVKLLLAPRGS